MKVLLAGVVVLAVVLLVATCVRSDAGTVREESPTNDELWLMQNTTLDADEARMMIRRFGTVERAFVAWQYGVKYGVGPWAYEVVA